MEGSKKTVIGLTPSEKKGLKNAPTAPSSTNPFVTKSEVSFTNELTLDENKPEITGVRYQTYDAAYAYILTQMTPNYFKRWVLFLKGTMTTNVSLRPWVFIEGNDGTASLNISSGSIDTVAGSTNTDAYQIMNLQLTSVDPVAGTTIVVKNCQIQDQKDTVNTGKVFLYDETVMRSTNNAAGPDLSSLSSVEILSGSKATVKEFSNISLWGDTYLNLTDGSSGTSLQAYQGGGMLKLDGDATVQDMWFYGNEIYGGNKLTVTGSSAQIANTLIYDADIEVSGASAKLTLITASRALGTESFTAIGGATIVDEGNFFTDPSFTSKTTNDAIKELANSGKGFKYLVGDSSMGGKYATPQDAIDAAKLAGDLPVDIPVLVGTYTGDITIDVDGINLFSFGTNNFRVNINGDLIVDIATNNSRFSIENINFAGQFRDNPSSSIKQRIDGSNVSFTRTDTTPAGVVGNQNAGTEYYFNNNWIFVNPNPDPNAYALHTLTSFAGVIDMFGKQSIIRKTPINSDLIAAKIEGGTVTLIETLIDGQVDVGQALFTATEVHLRTATVAPATTSATTPNTTGLIIGNSLFTSTNSLAVEGNGIFIEYNNSFSSVANQYATTLNFGTGTPTFPSSTTLAANKGGSTASRPANPFLYQPYFDTNIGFPIWWNGTNWVNATGAIV